MNTNKNECSHPQYQLKTSQYGNYYKCIHCDDIKIPVRNVSEKK